jgi:hypothetical protein
MRGETLYPLNQLRSVDPALYGRERAKYKGREAVLEFRIPLIDVLWNDTSPPPGGKSDYGRRSGSGRSFRSR